MVNMPTAEQIALVAAHVATTSPLMRVKVNGEDTIMPSEVPLQLRKEAEAETMEKMVTIACTLFYYNDDDNGDDYGDLDTLWDATLRCWAEVALGD